MQRIATVSDTILTINNSDKPITTQKELDTYKFSFDGSWSGFGKTAVFYTNESNVKNVPIPENGEVTIPWEVMVGSPERLYIGVFGTKGTTVKPTTIVATMLRKGSFIEGETSIAPTPNIYEQILTNYVNLSQRVDNIIATPTTVSVEEIIDARQGKLSLGANMSGKLTKSELKVHFKKTNELSDCILIQAPEKNIIIDFGSNNKSTELINFAVSKGITKIDIAIITHYHGDHSDGIANFLNSAIDFTDCVFYLPPTPVYASFVGDSSLIQTKESDVIALLNSKSIPHMNPIDGSFVSIDEFTKIRFLNVGESYYSNYYSITNLDGIEQGKTWYNNFSMVAEITHANNILLFGGDIGLKAQNVIAPLINNCDFYKVHHHNWDEMTDESFLRKINPKIAVTMQLETEKFDTKMMTTFLKLIGCEHYITGLSGDTTVYSTETGVKAKSVNGAYNVKNTPYYLTTANSILIKDGTDINTLVEPGVYICKTSASVLTLLNCPTTLGFKLIVEAIHDNTRIKQTIIDNTAEASTYIRSNVVAGWSTWGKIMTSANVNNELHGIPKNQIASGADLHTITTPGTYLVLNNTVASTLVNKPTGVTTGFILTVKQFHSADRLKLIIETNTETSDTYYKTLTSTGWGAWQKVTMIPV